MRRLSKRFTFSRGAEELASAQQANTFKFRMLYFVAMLALGVWVIEQVAPNFFNYPHWVWTLDWNNVAKFYPIFIWVTLATLVLSFRSRHNATAYDGAILRTETFGYMLTGIWEELMFRWALIPYSMLALVCMNWVWGFGVGYLLGAVMVVGAFGLIFGSDKSLANFIGGLVLAIVAGLCFWYGSAVDPIYFLFGEILIPIANWTTFGMMEPILTDRSTPLFLFGIFAANIAFRNGHKYLGPVGYVNSWYIGMVLVYATMTYGILTAIVLHAIYDIIIGVLKYIMRKMFG